MIDELREQAQSLTELPLDLIRNILDKHHHALCEELRDQIRKLVNERNHFRDRYDELVYAVAMKHEGETRHQTALRYIRERENYVSDAKAAVPTGSTNE